MAVASEVHFCCFYFCFLSSSLANHAFHTKEILWSIQHQLTKDDAAHSWSHCIILDFRLGVLLLEVDLNNGRLDNRRVDLSWLSLLTFFSSFFLRWRCAVARQWQFSVAVQCTMVWTTTDVRESSCYDYDDHSTEIESKRLSYFLKSALAHAFFYTTKDTTFSKASSSSSPGASAKVAFMWPFLPLWKYRQFSWAKNISSWKMHRMWWKRLCSDYT